MAQKPYHGVPYEVGGGDVYFHLKRGKISKKRYGTWEMGIEECTTQDCSCFSSREVDVLCFRNRVPHVFYTCPYCGVINAEHRAKRYMTGNLSLHCHACQRHLWIRLVGWDDKWWVRALKMKR